MGTKMLESASKRGIKLLNSHLELETTLRSGLRWKRWAAKFARPTGYLRKRYKQYG